VKILKQITISITVALGLGTLAYLPASPRTQALPASIASWRTAVATPLSELAAPLLHRDFTSSCLSDKTGFYRETLRFAVNATTTFARQYYTDSQCQELSQRESIQAGRFAVAQEEAGQLLLIVRNLQDERTADITPYFEALIKVDREQLVMQSSPSTTLHYTASQNSI
jgi:hypothetical protein